MANVFEISSLKPFNSKHAISEVIFSVYLASPIINSVRYESLVKDGGALSGNFQNFKVLTGIQLNMVIPPKDLEKSMESGIIKTGNDGFNIEKFKDGKLSWVISYQPSEPPTAGQDLLKIHCIDYDGWSSFFNEIVALLKKISEHEDLFIRGYSLYYLDQFFWTQIELPEMKYIFKKGNLYLSDLFLNTKGVWDLASNTNRSVDGKLVTENVNIGIRKNFNKDGNYLIYLFHNAATMIDEYKSLKELLMGQELKKLADQMHTLNKDFLGQTLTDEVQILIGLKDK
jgi:uncharacterized protein (TIGR04255 family)